MYTTQIVFSKSLLAPIQNACFPRNAIRVALLYNGFMLTDIQAFHIQKFSRISLGCKNFVFLHDTQFGFPDYDAEVSIIGLHDYKFGHVHYQPGYCPQV